MIKVTQLNGKELVINAELISQFEGGQNTIITLTTGNKIVVIDTLDELIRKVIEYKQEIMRSLKVTSTSHNKT